jgi:predicted ArsR family transcriptional regulator
MMIDSAHSYHNTTHETGSDLDKYEASAKSQEGRILAYFKSHLPVRVLLTPTMINAKLFADVPITSVRRALSNLTKKGLLVKAGKEKGPYGRPQHCWQLGIQPIKQADLFQ